MSRRGNPWTIHLPQSAEYALRALAFIALQDEAVAVRSVDLSRETGVPVHYLAKVLRRLVTGGLLHAKKGHGGGFSLARPPEKISLGDVLAVADADASENACAFGWGACDAGQPCPLHGSWSVLREAVQAWAADFTLADVREFSTSHVLMPSPRRRPAERVHPLEGRLGRPGR